MSAPTGGSKGSAAFWEPHPALACWVSDSTLGAVEALGHLGFDAIVLDLQHGPLEFRDVYAMLIALAATDTRAIVRVPRGDTALAAKLLDGGAGGVMFPNVETATEAAALLAACRYPPRGTRSYGPFRAGGAAGCVELEDAALRIVQIESVSALEAIDAIVATLGLDAIFIGPADLSLSAGGDPVMDYEDPDTATRHRRLVEAAHAGGVRVGMIAPTAAHLARALEWGADMVAVASDGSLLQRGAATSLETARAAVAVGRP